MSKTAKAKLKASPEKLGIRIVGTSPLSFDLSPGMTLTVKEFGLSANNRPTVGGKFKRSAYLLFNGITKVGRLSPKAEIEVGYPIPQTCKVVEVDREKKILKVLFP